MDEYKRENPCVDCGARDIDVLQFDHRNSADKVDAVNKLANSSSYDAVVKEIDKCDVRCANCHQLKHKEQYDKR